MGDEQPYAVKYLDEEGEETKYLTRSGMAKVSYTNGESYEGNFNEALEKHGEGFYIWKRNEETGDPSVFYKGNYNEGKKHGLGKLQMKNGDSYHGMWSNNKYQGEGSYVYSNGDMYSGNWERGKKNGDGTYFNASTGSKLIGTWKAGNIVKGKWVQKDGTSYEGNFKKNKPLGLGSFNFANGNSIKGEFVEKPLKTDILKAELLWQTDFNSLNL